MGIGEIITIVVVAVLMAAVIAYLIYKKVKGESVGCDCGGSCGSCKGCSHCTAKPDQKGDRITKDSNSPQT